MLQKITCANPQCRVEFEVGDNEAGQTVYCPQCGAPNETPALAAGTARAGAQGGEGAVQPPARQQCPNCGAVVGGRDAVCPECGAAMRAGAVTEGLAQKQKKNIAPFLIGGGIVVALVVLVVLVVVALKLLSQRREAEQRELERLAAQQQVVTRPGGEQEVVDVPEEELGSLPAQEQKIKLAVQAYNTRLAETLGAVRQLSAEQMAGRWADLYALCRESGLDTEAELCWYRAARLRPSDAATNEKLGRTEQFQGVPVTPEQKRFLETARPQLRVLNRDPDLANCTVRVGDGPEAPLGWTDAPEFTPGPGRVPITVSAGPPGETVTRQLAVDLQDGLVLTLTLRPAELAPAPSYGPLEQLYAAVSRRRSVGGVQVRLNAQQRVESAAVSGLRAEALDESGVAMQISRAGDLLTAVGSLSYGSRFHGEGQVIIQGDSHKRLVLGLAGGEASVRAGFFYTVQADLCDALWGMLGSAQGDFASEWARRKLVGRCDEVDFENRRLEAAGEFRGAWEADARASAEMGRFQLQVDRVLSHQDRAARQPDFVDRVRVLGIGERDEMLYLNWPRFRDAVAALTRSLHSPIQAHLNQMRGGAPAQREPTAGPRRRAGPPGPRGPGGPPAPEQETQEENTSFEPRAVALDEAGRRHAKVAILPLLPDKVLMDVVRKDWGDMPWETRLAAMMAMEKAATPEATAYLGTLSKDDPNAGVIAAALLSLGAIGTPEALQYCDNPTIVPEVRAASLAAKAAAGDPETLKELPRLLTLAGGTARARFLDYLVEMDAPGTVPALVKAAGIYTNEAGRKKIVSALIRIGGHAAMAELAALMEKTGDPFADALAGVRPAEVALLIRPVGRLVIKKQGGGQAVSLLLRNGSPAALAYVRAAVGQGNTAALQGLLSEGTSEAMTAAAAGFGRADVAMLRQMRSTWYSVKAPGQVTWKARASSEAVVKFLQAVLQSARDVKLRLAVVAMLREIGQPPGTETLFALAKEPARELGPERPARGGGGGGGRPGGPPAPPSGGGSPTSRRRSGPPARRQQVVIFTAAGYEKPTGTPRKPRGLEVPEDVGQIPFYALGMLQERASEAVSAQVRELADGYYDTQLKSAAMSLIAQVGGPRNLEFLRKKATASRSSYRNVSQLVRELQEREIALAQLGALQDTEMLPAVLKMLGEQAPAEKKFETPVAAYADLRDWWEMKVRTAACDCLSNICRDKQLFELTADAQLLRSVRERLLELIDRPGPDRAALKPVRTELHGAAVRAFGRCVDSYDEETRLLLSRLELMARQGAPVRRVVTPRPGPQRPQQGQETAPDPLRDGLRDAVVHIALRGGGPTAPMDVPSVMPAAGRADAAWSNLMAEMAWAPSREYFALVSLVYDSLSGGARDAIFVRARGKASAYDAAYAQFVVRQLKTALRAAAGPRVGPAAGPGRRGPSDAVRAIVAAARARAGTAAVRGGARPVAEAPSAGPPYRRALRRRSASWSYSINRLGSDAADDARQWTRIRSIAESHPTAVAAMLGQEDLLRLSAFGPALGAWCVEEVPSAQQAVVSGLRDVLTGGAGRPSAVTQRQEVPPETRRAAVGALSRIGGDGAAQALYDGLVGLVAGPESPSAGAPSARQGPPSGVRRGPAPGGRRGPPAGVRAGTPVGMGEEPAGPPPPPQALTAIALGIMGRDDLLNSALNAGGRAFFDRDRGATQRAALQGMAYLPPEQDPIQILAKLLQRAATGDLKRAAAEAVEVAIRLLIARDEPRA